MENKKLSRFKMIAAAVILAALRGQDVSAACTGGGLSWSCAAGSTVSQVQAAVDSAADGATLTFANGNYSWSSRISLNNKNGICLKV